MVRFPGRPDRGFRPHLTTESGPTWPAVPGAWPPNPVDLTGGSGTW